MIWLIVPPIIIAGMWGGQNCKGIRRFGIPFGSTTIVAAKDIKDKKPRWKLYLLSLLAFILSIGYGENSVYMKVFKKDWLVRIMYGLTLAVPFLVIDWRVGLASTILLPGAWSLRLGKFKINERKDGTPIEFLWDDFVRYGTLGCIIAYTIGG